MAGEVDPGAAALDGGGTPRLRPRVPTRRLVLWGGVKAKCGLGGILDEDCAGRGCVDPTGSPSGNAKGDLVATPGRRPRSRWIWWRPGAVRTTASSIIIGSAWGNAELRPGCYAGAAGPEQVVCVCGIWSTCVVLAVGRLACVVFDPVFLINRALYSIYGFWIRFPS